MGCQKSKCKLCGKEIKSAGALTLLIEESLHEKQKHPKIFNLNLKVKLEYSKRYKKLNDWLIQNEKIIFTKSEWDGEDFIDEDELI